jgi:mRNA interferase MazF
MICDFGDVVVVPFPFVDRPIQKRRPSLVVSARKFNEANGHSILAMITTAARSRWPSDIVIADLAAAGLPRACVLRWKLFTLPNASILRHAGAFGSTDRKALSQAARRILP